MSELNHPKAPKLPMSFIYPLIRRFLFCIYDEKAQMVCLKAIKLFYYLKI